MRELRAQVSVRDAPLDARRRRLQEAPGAAGHAADASDAAHATGGARACARAAAVQRPQAVGLRGTAQEEGVVAVAAAPVGEEGYIANEASLGGLTAPETRARSWEARATEARAAQARRSATAAAAYGLHLRGPKKARPAETAGAAAARPLAAPRALIAEDAL